MKSLGILHWKLYYLWGQFGLIFFLTSWRIFICFSCLIELTRTFSRMLSKSGGRWNHSFLIWNARLSSFPHSMWWYPCLWHIWALMHRDTFLLCLISVTVLWWKHHFLMVISHINLTSLVCLAFGTVNVFEYLLHQQEAESAEGTSLNKLITPSSQQEAPVEI